MDNKHSYGAEERRRVRGGKGRRIEKEKEKEGEKEEGYTTPAPSSRQVYQPVIHRCSATRFCCERARKKANVLIRCGFAQGTYHIGPVADIPDLSRVIREKVPKAYCRYYYTMYSAPAGHIRGDIFSRARVYTLIIILPLASGEPERERERENGRILPDR